MKRFKVNELFGFDFKRNSWVSWLSMLMALLGFMLSLSWITKERRSSRLDSLAPDQRVRLSVGALDLSVEYEKLRDEVQKLREENTRFQNAMATKTDQANLLNTSLQECKRFAGLTELEGPGVLVTLKDYHGATDDIPLAGSNVIHDGDVLRVANELWNAGAEGISVNGYRITVGSHFRCVGSVILVNNVKVAPPVVIQALGDKKTLYGALSLPGGVIYEIKQFGHPEMVEIAQVEKMRLPAYSGSTTNKISTVPEESH